MMRPWSLAVGTLIALALASFGRAADSQAATRRLVFAAGGQPGFTRLAPDQTGVGFTNALSDADAAQNQIRLNGSGVALGDVDGDRRPDLFFCGLGSANRLFRNLGDWKFEDVTADAPMAMAGRFCTGTVLADLDGDRDLDLLVATIGEGVWLFRNDGHGRFLESTESGILRKGGAMTMTLADVDNDGDLDLYVANYRSTTIRSTGFNLLNVEGKRVVPPALREDLELTPDGRVLEHGEPDLFYLNDGHGRFRPTPWTGGRFLDEKGERLAKAPRDWGLTATFRDLNQDGYPDLYVANDFHSPDRIWINRGNGQFQALPGMAIRQTSTFSMSVDFADLDRDGWDDFFLTDMLDRRLRYRKIQANAMESTPAEAMAVERRPQVNRNTLFWNRGDGTYAEIAYFAGLEAAGWSWSVVMLDVDLDGREDILLTTGNRFDTQDLDAAARIERAGPSRRELVPGKLLLYPPLPLPKAAFRNLGGWRFGETSAAWGFADSGVAHGMALADLDGDGDLDVVVNQLNGPAGLYRNNSSAPRVALRLHGEGPNSTGVGARVSLIAPGLTQSQEIQAGGRYLSSDDTLRVFAWPEGVTKAEVGVVWRSGKTSRIPGVTSNTLLELNEAEAIVPAAPEEGHRLRHPASRSGSAWFEDVSDSLGHQHRQGPVDDFEAQPLLPRQLSRHGPALAWHDVDDDGRDELVVSAGRDLGFTILSQDPASGSWKATGSRPRGEGARREIAGIAGDPLVAGGLLMTLDHPGAGRTDTNGLVRVEPKSGGGVGLPGAPDSSLGVLAVTDYDGDGDLDLFAGGRWIPGRYPEPPRSLLLRQEAGRLVPDPALLEAEGPLGMVNGAAWTDLESDGYPELVTASEWGLIRIFRNQQGRFSAWDGPVRFARTPGSDQSSGDRKGVGEIQLSSWTGLWMSVASGDFDGDGRPDLLVGNWGLNSRLRASAEHPLRLYYGDFDGSGSTDLFETAYDEELGKEVPGRGLVALQSAVPSILAKFGSHAAFASASIQEVLGEAWGRHHKVEAIELASWLLLNRGDHFDAIPLPDAAQWTPVMGIVVADFDGDGDEDAFLAQNFFAVEPMSSRIDAGRGLLLRNGGEGQFEAESGPTSGLLIYGEQRGCAAGDFDRDGRIDLVVGQNNGPTRLFHNVGARPGLRLRLAGKGGKNPHGLGVAIRWSQARTSRPVHEVQSHGGSSGQNSLYPVVAMPEGGGVLDVRWPGGAHQRVTVPPEARELRIQEP